MNILDEPTWLHTPGIQAVRVKAWKWDAGVASNTTRITVGDGVGGLVAELALKTLDGSIRLMFTNNQIEAWTFDGHIVVPRD